MIDQEEINIGSVPNDGTGDTIRVSFHKTNNNFSEVYGAIANTENDVIDLENVIVTNTGLVRVNAVYTIVNTVFAVTNSSYVHANASFDRANGATLNVTAAFGKANSIPINVAFTKANAAFDLASSAYDFANGISTNTFVFSNLTNTVFGFANTINTFAYGVSTNTTAAFDKANSINLIPGFTKANDAYDLANGAYVYANTLVSESTNLIPVFTQANSAYDLANGAYIYANTINLVPYALSTDVANVNTFAYGVESNSVAAFAFANSVAINTAAAFDKANAANVLAYNTGIGANAYADVVGSSSNAYSSATYAPIVDPTFTNNLTVNKLITIGGVVERLTSNTNSISGIQDFDCSNNYIFYINNVTGPFTPNLQNFTISTNTATAVTIIVDQSASANITTSNVLIGAANLAINWQGGTPPTGTANKKDIINLSVFNINGTNTVIGQLTTFG